LANGFWGTFSTAFQLKSDSQGLFLLDSDETCSDFLIAICPFHWFGWSDYNFVPAFRANVRFAAGAGKTVAARFQQLLFIPYFSAVEAGN
jgi:hypothetical protein